MHYLAWDPDLYVPVISCMESADDPVMSAEGCITQLSTASYEAVKGCAKVIFNIIMRLNNPILMQCTFGFKFPHMLIS